MSGSSRQSSPLDQKAGHPAGTKAQTFEKALAELERIVGQMEAGNLSLEQSLAAHKRGLELARFCQERLEAAQQQVKVLEGEVLRPLAEKAAEKAQGEAD